MMKNTILQVMAALLMCLGIFSGCATQDRKDELLARLLADVDMTTSYADPDAPDQGLSALPPPLGGGAFLDPSTNQSVAAVQDPSTGGNTNVESSHIPSGLGDIVIDPGPKGRRGRLTIQPDCVVRVTVKEDESLDGSYPVNEIGAIEFGRIGPVFLHNSTEKEAAAKIQQRLLARDFRKATVSVDILRASYDKVRISGAVPKPGVIPIGAGAGISLNDALLRVGGLKNPAKGTRVRIVRDGLLFAIPSALEGEEYELVDKNGKPNVPKVALRNNDIAFVYSTQAAQAGPRGMGEKTILVFGEVRREGPYRFAADERCTIMYLIFKMGGLPPYANVKKIKIIRKDDDGNEEEIIVNAQKVLEDGDPEDDFPLENGDRIKVPARGIRLF